MRRFLCTVVFCCVSVLNTEVAAQQRNAKRSPGRVSANKAEEALSAPLKPGSSGSRVMRAQVLLDRARYSPGEIDSKYGDDLGTAVKGFQQNHGLEVTGAIDAAMWDLLNEDQRPLLHKYTVTAEDVRGPFEPVPEDVQGQARAKALGFESVQEELGEKFHVSPRLLAELNPGKHFKAAGEEITVPNVERGAARRAAKVVVSASKRTVIAYDLRRTFIAQYPTTIGGDHDPLPIGHWVITVVEQNPIFYFDPAHLWNADPNEAKAKLPPGPNNPAGVVWMGLSKRHYGIHGSPDPGHIRHGESAGCVRMTNWDAEELSHMVRRGTPVILEE